MLWHVIHTYKHNERRFMPLSTFDSILSILKFLAHKYVSEALIGNKNYFLQLSLNMSGF